MSDKQFERDIERHKSEAYAHNESQRQQGQAPVQTHRGIAKRAYNAAKWAQIEREDKSKE